MSEQGQPPGAGFEIALLGLGAGACASGVVAWLGARLGTLLCLDGVSTPASAGVDKRRPYRIRPESSCWPLGLVP